MHIFVFALGLEGGGVKEGRGLRERAAEEGGSGLRERVAEDGGGIDIAMAKDGRRLEEVIAGRGGVMDEWCHVM